MSNYTNTSPLTSDVSLIHGLIAVGDNNSSVLLDPLSLISTATNSSTIDIDITGNVISASIIPSSISSTHLSSTLLTAINKGDTAIQPSSLGVQVQPFSNNLQSISNIDSGIGLLKRLSNGSWELDTNTYQPSSLPLSSISNISTDGVLVRAGGAWNTYQALNVNTTGLSGGVSNSLTFISGGGGVLPGTTFNGSGPVSVSYNSIGAPSVLGANASGTWDININGNSATSTLATTATLALSSNTLSQTLPVDKGGTGGTTAEVARSSLGLTYATGVDVNGYTFTANTTSGSSTITSTTALALSNGDIVRGPGIPSNTTVLSGAGTTSLVLSANATSTQTNASYTSYRIDRVLTTATSAAGVAKAWINFNGTGTIAVRSSNNISSITDNGTGDYTLNFIEPMNRTNYCVVVTTGTAGIIPMVTNLLVNSVTIQTYTTASVSTDVSSINVVVFA